MNRYFEFSRRQLYVLAVLCTSAAALGSYAALARLDFSAPEPAGLPLTAGTFADPALPALSIGGMAIGSFVLDPNTAPSDSLELLPGIGPTKAAAMIAARDTLPFAGPDDLLRVDGIGPKTLQKVRPFIKIAGPETPAP